MIVWQDLTPEQIASVREARLGGALGAILAGAAGLAVVGGAVSVLGAAVNATLIIFQIQLWIIVAWAVVFIGMTLARAESTPRVSAGLLFACVLLRSLMTVLGYARTGLEGATLANLLAVHVAYLLFELALAAAFWGYMTKGIRPNLYYRQRIPIVQPG